ncbi:MAG TPA: hypothetical protein VFY20_11130 [Gemmatimonadales bacterium]|nr:hypothetical protein [Gemmatimonadales bacterium]
MRASRGIALLAAFALAACSSSRYVEVAPRLDLRPVGPVGLVTFTTVNARAAMGERATQQFAEQVLGAQSGIEVLEIEPSDSLLRYAADKGYGPEFAQAVGREKNVAAVFVGTLEVTGAQPGGVISSVRNMQVGATVTGTLTVKLLSAKSGGTMWQASSTATEKIGEFSLSRGTPSVTARDPDDAYAAALARLVDEVTRDVRPTWRKE